MNWLKIASFWLFMSVLPLYAGSWYDLHFPVFQAATSAIILFVSLRISREWWVLFLADLSVIQILFNTGDALLNISPSHYNDILNVLNTLEAIVIFGCGGFTQLYRALKNGTGNRNHDSGVRRVSSASGLSRSKNGV